MLDALFSGVGAALVTLYDESGEVDEKGTARHARRLVDEGIAALVTSGSTGEGAALSAEERMRLLGAVRNEVADEVPVLASTGAFSARQAASLTKDAYKHDADAILALSPPGSRSLKAYYDAIVEAADGLPVLAYHFPEISAPGVPATDLADLPVHGIKDSSGDPEQLLQELTLSGKLVYTGSSALLALAGPMGCQGAILALANAEPRLCVRAFAGDVVAQRELTQAHVLHRREFPAGLKALVAERYGTSSRVRL